MQQVKLVSIQYIVTSKARIYTTHYNKEKLITTVQWIMDTEREEMSELHSQSEDEATISSILGAVFPAEKEEETTGAMFSAKLDEEKTTMSSAKPDEEGITMFSAKLDEEEFGPLVEQGELPSIPTEEEFIKYPELEYSSREVQAIVNKMDRAQKQEFHEYEQYFLTRYRQTGNMKPLYVEVRNIVKEMCPSMPGQMQSAVVEARAQLLAEVKLKKLCKQLGVPAPWYEPPPMVHPVDEGILRENAVPMSGEESHEGSVKEDQLSTSKAVRKIIPTLVTTEAKREVKPQVQPRLLSDMILDAMGPGDEECMVTRIKRGRDPFYDLTQDDEELKQAFAEVGPEDIPEEELDVDDLSVASLETVNEIENEEASRLLTTYADLKMKEAETLQDMVALIKADDLGPRQCYEIVKHITKMEGDIPEIAQIREEFDYESIKLILAAGVRMKQVYDVNMKQCKRAESLVSIVKWFNVSKSQLYEMTAGHKIGRPAKSFLEKLELDTPADAQISATQVVKHQADNLGKNQGAKRQRGEMSSTKKGGKIKSTAL